MEVFGLSYGKASKTVKVAGSDRNGAKLRAGSAQPRPPKGIFGLKLEGEPVVSRI